MRDDVSLETNLLTTWPEAGPERRWLFENAGVGYSGISVVKDRLYTMGSRNGKEELICLNSLTGEEIWATPVSDEFDNKWGNGPRSTPTVEGDFVYTLSAGGTVLCANRTDGSAQWSISLTDFGGEVPGWGYTESVLIEGDHLICTPGGSQGTLLALNKTDGTKVWQSIEFTDPAHYASIIAADVHGQRQLIQVTEKSVVGIAADSGKLLWKTDWPGAVAVIPTPVYRDGHVYVTSSYSAGCNVFQISPDNQVAAKYDEKAQKMMKNHHGGVVLVGDSIFGYSDGVGWLCHDFLSGEVKWRARDEFGKGAITAANGQLVLVSESEGEVALIDAATDGWHEHGRFTLDPQTELRKPDGRIWVHPVVVNGKLYLRDQDLIYCYNVSNGTE
ncbi:MAG: PQQ-binding-like beta-propeller repeat protein [Pirellulaceae bacterium]